MPAFAQINAQLQQLFAAQDYARVIDVAAQELTRFPAERPTLDYWQLCAAARLGQNERVYQLLESRLAEGFWYGEMLLRQSPSFQPLQGQPEFERLVAASGRQARASAAPTLIVRTPQGAGAAPPLLIALHGNASTALNTLPFWEAAVSAGWALAVPQSSAAMWKGAHMWVDLASAEPDLRRCWEAVQGQIDFDPARVVMAGHSMGGGIAAEAALSGRWPARGFVLNGPAVPFFEAPEALQAVLGPARERGLRGYLLLGERDDQINADEVRQFAATLTEAGISCPVEPVPGATHDFTPAYVPALLRGLEHILAAA